MILACPKCSRQYRVDQYAPGQHVRCLCGQRLTVPASRSHSARILHCSDCGGPLTAQASQCDYCGGVVDPNQHHYTQMCPKCFARLPEKARFCIECAMRIRPEEVVCRERSLQHCPRDGEALQARGAQGVPYQECPRCLGLWLDAEAFREICSRKTSEFESNPLPEARVGAGATAEPVVYLRCPTCDGIMNRENFGRRSGVIVDRCVVHGVWLDDRELERIARFIAEGGLVRSRQLEAEAAVREARRAPAAPMSRGGTLGGEGSFGEGFLFRLARFLMD